MNNARRNVRILTLIFSHFTGVRTSESVVVNLPPILIIIEVQNTLAGSLA